MSRGRISTDRRTVGYQWLLAEYTDSQVFAFDNDDGANGQLRSPGVLYRVCGKGGGEEIEIKLLPNTVGISVLFSSFYPPSGLRLVCYKLIQLEKNVFLGIDTNLNVFF